MITVERSPAKVAWWVMYEGTLIEALSTRNEALELKATLEKAMGL